jgi:hypothetical protein
MKKRSGKLFSRKGEGSNPKFEIRNSKQIQMFKKEKVLNGPFWILNLGFAGFGLFRISIFRFRILLILAGVRTKRKLAL